MIEVKGNKASVTDNDSEHENYERERIRRANEVEIRGRRVKALKMSAMAHTPLFGKR